jgi:ABC-type multidrug transport system ATPase subunit
VRAIAGPEQSLVELRGAAKRYRFRGSWVLSGLHLQVGAGCAIEVRGRNGAGKSTLLRMVAGATLPTRGRRVAARGVRVGYAPERLSPAPPFPVSVYLAHHARVRGLARGGAAIRTLALAERLGLGSDLLVEQMSALSKGSLQKVSLIQALLADTGLVILDEPFSGLDAEASLSVCELISETTQRGGTVVFSDHREGDVRPRVDLAWRVADGQVIADVPAMRAVRFPAAQA